MHITRPQGNSNTILNGVPDLASGQQKKKTKNTCRRTHAGSKNKKASKKRVTRLKST